MHTLRLGRGMRTGWVPGLAVLLGALLLSGPVFAAEAEHPPGFWVNPVIKGLGPAHIWPEDVMPPTDRTYKVVFEISNDSNSPDKANPTFNRVANTYNSFVAAGVPRDQVKIVVALHGNAGRDVLDDAVYEKHFHTHNPNIEALGKLDAAGVRIRVCGVTLAKAGWTPKDLLPYVKPTVSEWVALVRLQNEGYALLNFPGSP